MDYIQCGPKLNICLHPLDLS